MRQLRYLFLIVLITLMGGCAKIDDRIVLDNKGSAMREITVTIDKSHESYSKENAELSLSKAGKFFSDKGYTVKRVEENEEVTILKMTQKIEGVDKENITVLFNGESERLNEEEILTISQKDNFYFANHNSSSNVSLNYLKESFGTNNIDYRLYVSFPAKVHGVHNAHAVRDDGKTLAWKLPIDKNQKIVIDVYTIDASHTMMVGGPILGILLVAFYLMATNKEKKRTVQRRQPLKRK